MEPTGERPLPSIMLAAVQNRVWGRARWSDRSLDLSFDCTSHHIFGSRYSVQLTETQLLIILDCKTTQMSNKSSYMYELKPAHGADELLYGLDVLAHLGHAVPDLQGEHLLLTRDQGNVLIDDRVYQL